MSDQDKQIIQEGFDEDDDLGEEPMVQGIVYDNGIEGGGAVRGTLEIQTELEDSHPYSPENLARDSGSASPSQPVNDQKMLFMRKMMAKMELRLGAVEENSLRFFKQFILTELNHYLHGSMERENIQ